MIAPPLLKVNKMPTNAQMRTEQSLKVSIARQLLTIHAEHWTSEAIYQYRSTVNGSDSFKSLLHMQRNRLNGAFDCIHESASLATSHGYFCVDGKFRVTDIANINYKFQRYVYSLFSDNGKGIDDTACVLIWESAPDKVYYASAETLAKYSDCFTIADRVITINNVAMNATQTSASR